MSLETRNGVAVWRGILVRAGGCMLALLMAAGWVTGAEAGAKAKGDRIRLVPTKQVKINDAFWGPKLRVYKERTIRHSWQYMGGEIRALQRAGGVAVQGDLNGTWGEANLYKFMETIAHSLGMHPDAELEKRADEVVALVARAQRPDGYAHAYVINSGKRPWDPGFLDGSHDGYVLGHMIEAALEYYANTGKRAFLDVACKAADQAYEHFLGPKGEPGFCGHAELEMALVELYRIVPEQRYLELAKAFIEWRGHQKVKPFSETPRAYFQDGAPLREQRTLEGHAVRAVFFATGVADVAIETGDWDYRLAANRFWDSTTLRRMAITGSVGPRKEHEAFGEDYELPNNGYYESCAACGLADLAQRMFLLEERAECADVLERVLYNAILHGISLDGTTTYYMNPLSDRDNLRYNSWVCCPPNLSRTLLQVGRYAYGYADREVYVNLYVGGNCTVPLKSGAVALNVETNYPWSGDVKIRIETTTTEPVAMNLRMPGWCEKARLLVNGQGVPPLPRNERGYLRVERAWNAGDVIELAMEMPVQRMEAHPNIKDCVGKVALQRGPIIYGLEGVDNGGAVNVELGADPGFQVEHRAELLGGVDVIKGTAADGKAFVAIPFYAMANRGKSSQEVWIGQRGMKAKGDWWLGQLYRPWRSAEK
ncbi:MAG: glycoside hydrolase family 127 protein [Bacillota bacterium]